ncbi:MAG: VOC family protein [Candidatus Cloacimonetes bacterium]|nr:VOC family protein [Candidatus Cloacimonadota bacterium]
MKDLLVWFEIPVIEMDRAMDFYKKILEIKMKKEEMGGSIMGFFMGEEGNMFGALSQHKDFVPSKDGIVAYLNGGEDLQVVLDKIETAGGKIIVPKTQITPEIGYFAWFLDTEGNRLALWSQK